MDEIIEKRKLDTSPLQAPYKPLIRDSNYINLNLNSNSNINIRQPSAEALPLSEQKEIQNCQKEIQDEVDDSSLDCMNYAVIDDTRNNVGQNENYKKDFIFIKTFLICLLIVVYLI